MWAETQHLENLPNVLNVVQPSSTRVVSRNRKYFSRSACRLNVEPEMKIHLNTREPEPSRKSCCDSILVVIMRNGR